MKKTIIAALLALPLPAFSQTCDPAGTQQQMNQCAFEDFERADAALNAEYKRAMAFAKDIGIADQVRTAQRAWIPYRDAACAAEAAKFEGGSIMPLIRFSCLATLTEERTKHLKLIDEN